MPAVAMTDHGNLFGAVQFYNAAKDQGMHPDHRLRGLRLAAGAQGPLGDGPLQPPDAALRKPGGLPQPDRPGLHRATWRASTTSRASTRTCWRSIPRGSSRCRPACAATSTRSCWPTHYEDARRLAYTYRRHLRPRQLLPRASGPRPGAGQARCCRRWTACRARPAFRWWPPTIRTTCARKTPARTRSCSASRPARP